MHNAEVAEHLEAIALYQKILRTEGYKYRAENYEKAAKLLRTLDHEVITAEEAETYEGIGKKISKVIEEFSQTGTSSRLKVLREQAIEREPYIKLFTSIYGIGVVIANKLYDKKIRSLQQLEENKNILTRAQLLGLKYRDRSLQKVPRTEIRAIEKEIRKILLPYGFLIIVVGSYRRGKEESGDIDVLVTHPDAFNSANLSDIINYLNGKVLLHKLAQGERLYSGITITERRIDIKLFTDEEYPAALMHFTGSAKFNINVRKVAFKLGMKLNEYELVYRDTGKQIEVKTERDIFNVLGMKYVSPIDRD